MKLRTFFDNFEYITEAPNGIQKLREMVLQLAMQGNLVPRDPNDEPASVLFEKIQNEKKRLIDENIIRKPKPLLPVDTNELPYTLPREWKWVRIQDIIKYAFTGLERAKRFQGENFKYFYFKMNNIGINGECNFDSLTKINASDDEAKRYTLTNGDFLFNTRNSYELVGKTCVYFISTPKLMIFNNNILKIEFMNPINQWFINLWFISQAGKALLNNLKSATTNVAAIYQGKLMSLLVPIPPVEEQARIVSKVDEMMALCDDLEVRKQKNHFTCIQLNDASIDRLLTTPTPEKFNRHWKRICDNFDLLYNMPEKVNKLRQAILQLAVQGKLVPQDKNDDPASKLLERIKAEKEQLVKDGKIKYKKPSPIVGQDEAPYDLPGSWMWTRLETIGLINPRNVVDDDIDISFIPMKLIPIILGEKVQFERRKWGEIKKGFTHLSEGDVGLAKITPCFQNGKSVVMQNLINKFGAGTTELHVFRPIAKNISPEYVLLFLKSPNFIKDGIPKMTGSAGQKRVPAEYFYTTPFPLPPANEQKRIVTKVHELMALCDELESKLSQGQLDNNRLVEAAVADLLVA